MQTFKRKFPRQVSRQDGFTLIETMIALAIITPMAIMGAQSYMNYQDRQLAATAATQHMSIAEAARSYLTDNYEDVNAALSDSSAEYLDQLVADGYLDNAQFGDGGEVNPFGQEYRVYYYQGADNADPIETLVIAQGAPSTSPSIQHTINRHMGVTSAYVDESGNLVSSFYDTVSYDLGPFGESSAPEGSVAYFDTLDRQASTSDYLYRYSVAGFPELNRMQTDLDMDGNNVNNANEVNAQTLNAAQAATVGGGADTVTAQDGNLVASGDVTAEGVSYARSFMNPDDDRFSFDPAATAENSTIRGLTVGQAREDRLVAGGYLRLESHGDTSGDACDQDGMVTVDSDGMLLSCQSGAWKGMDKAGQLATVGTLDQMVGVTSIPFIGAGGYTQCSYGETGRDGQDCLSYRIKTNGNLEFSSNGVTYTGDRPCTWYSVGGARCGISTNSNATWAHITSAGIHLGSTLFSWVP